MCALGTVLLATSASMLLAMPASAATSSFVTRSGTSLTLDGQPFRFTGLNIYNANSNGLCWYPMDGTILDHSLVDIGPGKTVFRAWFFQQLATSSGARDWTAFDRTIATARAHGIRIIATLIDQWGNCGSTNPVGGYKNDAWYTSGYTQIDPVGTVSYRDWTAEVAARYRDDPTILAWQLVNEAEVKPSVDSATCSANAAGILKSFAIDVSARIKATDANHLISLGTLGTGQCGASGPEYQDVHSVATIDLCEYHDYDATHAMPGDIYNGLQVRLNQCNALQKPLFVGESGIKPVDLGPGATLATRANAFKAKFDAQFPAGVVGELVWAWDKDGSTLDNFDLGPADPVLHVLSHYGTNAIPWTTIERVSVDSNNQEHAGQSYGGSLSANGRFVAFMSDAPLVAGDANGQLDIYVRDRQLSVTERVSVGPGGQDPNAYSVFPVISGDGRYVAFESSASNLVPGDTNNWKDIFVYDRTVGTTERVSVATDGTQSNNESNEASISRDGRFVAFYSRASNLVVGDTHGRLNVFVHDRMTGTTELVSTVPGGGTSLSGDSFSPSISADGRFVSFVSNAPELGGGYEIFVRDRLTAATELVSVSSSGVRGDGLTSSPAMSGDGRFVVFQSNATSLVPGDTNGVSDIYLRDRQAGTIERISVATGGGQGDGDAVSPGIRDDGRIVVFQSLATNLIAGDTNGGFDVFARDRQRGTTERISVTAAGEQGNGFSGVPAISADGQAVVFRSRAANLVVADTNGELDVLVRSAALAPPDATTNVMAVAGNGQASVSWSAPGSDGGDTVTGYTVTSSPGGLTATVNGTTTSATVSGLTNGTTYRFTVLASNAIGAGPSSDPSNTVTPTGATAPGSPTNIIAAAGDGTASVSWSAPASDGGSPITSYLVTSSSGQTAGAGANASTATIGGLTNGVSYSFTVTATNAIGPGPASSASAAVVPQAGAQAATATVPANSPGSATTDPGGGPTPSAPLTTAVMVPATTGGGSVSIVQAPATGNPPTGGYQFVGLQVDIVSTATTSSTNPLTIVFTVDGSAIAQADGLPDPSTVDITRTEGGTTTVLPTCTVTTPALALDPCVLSRVYVNGNTDLQVTVLTSTASRWNTVIKPVRVTVLDTGYNPRLAAVSQGAILQWTFGGQRAHTVTDSLGLGPSKTALFNSGPVVSGRYGYVFRAAGTYPYRSTAKGDPGSMTGSIAVPVLISPTSGGVTTTFKVRWASAPLSGYVFDVRYRFKKAGSNEWSDWKSWETGQSAIGDNFISTRGVGSYSFEARLRNSNTGVSSDWSPETMVVVR